MQQQFQYREVFLPPIHYVIDIDDNLFTVRMFIDVVNNDPHFIPGVDPNIFELVTDASHPLLSRHRVELEFDQETGQKYSVVLGELIKPEFEGLWLKFVGAAQIERTQVGIFSRNSKNNFQTPEYYRLDGDPADNIQTGSEYEDCMLWSFDFNFSGMNWQMPYNQFVLTKATKMSWDRYDYLNQFNTDPRIIEVQDNLQIWQALTWKKRILSLFLFEKDSSFTNASLYCNTSMIPDFKFSGDVTVDQFENNPALLAGYDILPIPKIKVTGSGYLKPNELGNYMVELYNHDGVNDVTYAYDTTCYITCKNGYVGKEKISVVGGFGTFKARALDLDPGDIMEIKIGFKNFSNHHTHIIEVI